jgi:hypothetical protein
MNKGPTEIQLKADVLNRLIETEGLRHSSLVINELPLGNTSVRADLVTLSNDNSLCGIEIKSERDNLTRLHRQADVYLQYFDRVIVVVGERHAKRIDRKDFPEAEVWVSRADGIHHFRKPSKRRPAKRSGVELLTQKQLKEALVETDERVAYCNALKMRFTETSQAFWKTVEGRKVEAIDLKRLSRFEQNRLLASELKARADSKWSQWAEFFKNQSTQSSSVS